MPKESSAKKTPIKKMGKSTKKKEKREIPVTAQAHVKATFNNTIVTIANNKGEVLVWGSAGTTGFKGTRKSTPYAATTSAKQVAEKAKGLGVEKVAVYVKGAGLGRDSAVRAIKAAGLQVLSISDITPIPHNGSRPRKKRRV